jgi:hypothetical protein
MYTALVIPSQPAVPQLAMNCVNAVAPLYLDNAHQNPSRGCRTAT